MDLSVSHPFLPRGTLSQHYQYLAAPLDAKIDLKIKKLIAGGTFDTILRHPGREPLGYIKGTCKF